MNLLELYKTESQVKQWYDFYFSTADENGGKIFKFFNTNYRKLLSFQEGFIVLKRVDNIPRTEWTRQVNNGQEIEKQHIRNMFCSKIFSKNENKFYASEKGRAFEDMLYQEFSDEARSFLIYLFILDGYFDNKINYISKTVKKFYCRLEELGISEETLNLSIKDFIKKESAGESIFKLNYTYIDSFYKKFEEVDFLEEYINASIEDKKQLMEYIEENYKNKNNHDKNNMCVLSYKYRPSGVYVKSTLIDNAKILYMTNYILKYCYNKSFSDFIKQLITEYCTLFPLSDQSKVYNFIFERHKNVFETIYNNIFEIDVYKENSEEDSTIDTSIIEPEGKIDDTDFNNIEKSKRVNSILKKLAKQRAEYRCELEELHNCTYFTSKETLKNYLEVHHLVPREFSNEFEKTIEVIENYVALCPNCHRLIHLAVDRERLQALNYLIRKRKEALEQKGITIDQNIMKEYYSIEE